jgi:hypothetical protein
VGNLKLADQGYSGEQLLDMPLADFELPTLDNKKRRPSKTSIKAAKHFHFKYMDIKFGCVFSSEHKLTELARKGFIYFNPSGTFQRETARTVQGSSI